MPRDRFAYALVACFSSSAATLPKAEAAPPRPDQCTQLVSDVGEASWYGPGFHGKETSNGEIFNQNALTAAHKSLPENTWVLVENEDNGAEVIVRINDYGPHVAGRVIDLSKKAGERIGIDQSGHAPVTIYRCG